jgi:hypothetical protein
MDVQCRTREAEGLIIARRQPQSLGLGPFVMEVVIHMLHVSSLLSEPAGFALRLVICIHPAVLQAAR